MFHWHSINNNSHRHTLKLFHFYLQIISYICYFCAEVLYEEDAVQIRRNMEMQGFYLDRDGFVNNGEIALHGPSRAEDSFGLDIK